MHPRLAAAHSHSVVQALYTTIVLVFGTNVSPHSWEAFTQSRCKLSEHLQSSWGLPTIVHKHSAIIDLIKLSKYTDKCPHLIVYATSDSVNKGVNANCNR